MWGKILTGYEQLNKVPYPRYRDYFNKYKERISNAIHHLSRFGIRIYLGRSRLYVPGMPETREICTSDKLFTRRLYQNRIHPEMADRVLSTIDVSMIDLYNNLEEITAVYPVRISRIKDVAKFINASSEEKIKIIKEAKIIAIRTITHEEKDTREKARKNDILDIIERHTRQRILRFP
ncbi:MAG: hypothetical protein NT030_05175 [Candidatus Saganbacteria bacterium]|nr:hypothetical protein [Candidatus Saganbacteria bacterium]